MIVYGADSGIPMGMKAPVTKHPSPVRNTNFFYFLKTICCIHLQGLYPFVLQSWLSYWKDVLNESLEFFHQKGYCCFIPFGIFNLMYF